MQLLFKNFIRIAPIATGIVFLLFIQLLSLGTNLIGIILFARLYSFRDLYKVLTAVLITSLLYDAIKMLPLGAWSLSFCATAIIGIFILHVLKMQGEKELESWPTTIFLIGMVIISSVGQAYILSLLSGQKSFDFTSLYSIVSLSALCVLFLKFNHKKERKLLLD